MIYLILSYYTYYVCLTKFWKHYGFVYNLLERRVISHKPVEDNKWVFSSLFYNNTIHASKDIIQYYYIT